MFIYHPWISEVRTQIPQIGKELLIAEGGRRSMTIIWLLDLHELGQAGDTTQFIIYCRLLTLPRIQVLVELQIGKTLENKDGENVLHRWDYLGYLGKATVKQSMISQKADVALALRSNAETLTSQRPLITQVGRDVPTAMQWQRFIHLGQIILHCIPSKDFAVAK